MYCSGYYIAIVSVHTHTPNERRRIKNNVICKWLKSSHVGCNVIEPNLQCTVIRYVVLMRECDCVLLCRARSFRFGFGPARFAAQESETRFYNLDWLVYARAPCQFILQCCDRSECSSTADTPSRVQYSYIYLSI